MKKVTLSTILSAASIAAMAQVSWPAINQETRPWARWWWEGSAVDQKNLTANMQDYKNAGLGGLEITPIYGVKGYEKQFINFLSPQWMQMLDFTLKEAKRLNLGIDIANGTGWPFGGPWIKDKDASKTVYYKNYQLKGGEQLNEAIVYKTDGFVSTANTKKVSVDTLNQDIASNKDLQGLALDQVKFPMLLPVQILMAYSDNGQKIDLTNKVDASGKLNWTAPEGNWNLYALFQGLHGKMVERAAPGGEGYAIDHFSAEAIHTFLSRFDEAFKGHDISYIRALFNDSYEVDDARSGQHNWTPKMFEEFQQRRGYDLRNYLPALFQKADEETNKRVLYDYRATIDELILEHFTKEWKKWGDTKGTVIRNQSHGSPANLLDLYGAIDIPETEGTDIMRFKFATSAANVTGKRLSSSESATWLNEHFLSNWGDVKKALDLFMLGGVNHIFYHGVNYSPKGEAWPGWLFYAAVHFNQSNPQWKDFKALNDYVARSQSFLQMGKPDNNVLLYFPLVDRYMEPGRVMLQHFDGIEKNFEGTDFAHTAEWMQEKGYGFDFFSDRQLQKMTTANGNIMTGGNNYQTILLPANKFIPEATFQKLLELANNGAQILVYKSLPQDVPGFNKLQDRRTAFQNLVQQIRFTDNGKVKKAVVGKGAFILSDDMEALLDAAKVRRETLHEAGIQFIRKRNNDGYTYFLDNRTDKAFSGWVPLSAKAASVALFDPMFAKSGIAKSRQKQNGTVEVYVQLRPSESAIVQTFNTKKTGTAFPYVTIAGDEQEIKGTWTIEFVSGGPKLPAKVTTDKLGSWTNLDGDDVKNFSGTAKYSISFAKPLGKATAWQLDLGHVDETAEVFLNGKKVATLIGPEFKVEIPAASLQANNKLEVLVSNLMANRIIYMDKNCMQWKKFYNINMSARKKENVKNGVFDASGWEPQASGLAGPVTLTPITRIVQ
ncbi:glycosyl hydrolase [Chitinophagaceae bacterium LB-8]|uniref:Glycosyl hydrolase n=1 Tax=Paraflavisolibacter caeni TaxID=2982496 RepID=A0A9X2XXB4_9BACT|nr:glycosyl hydrolase [Paraflavisolibacter caeni]MCU7551209.1 glycosyl hydrolase [Paraflavisolibacter caeni]